MPRNKHLRKATFSVQVRNEMAPRLRDVQERWGLDVGQAVELGLNLAAVASGGTVMRAFGGRVTAGGKPESVKSVLGRVVPGRVLGE
jgi:hypothetical protein